MLQVDVCLYFIAAHRLKLIDIKFMQAISTNVAIIPVIAKADSYVHCLRLCA
jgi:septin family protein